MRALGIGSEFIAKKDVPRTLFASRPLKNASELIAWAKEQGFETAQLPEDMHVTLAYSKTPLVWPARVRAGTVHIRRKDGRSVEPLGDNGAVVLKFASDKLTERWQELCEKGCSYDHEKYQPHVTITWQAPPDLDLSQVKPFEGELVFGPEVFKEINEDWQEDHVEKGEAKTFAQVLKEASTPRAMSFAEVVAELNKRTVPELHDLECSFGFNKADKKLGIVFGWAMVCKINGEDYVDTQNDHIPEDSMLQSAAEFMQTRREMKIMHAGNQKGTVVFAFPLTTDIAKAFGIEPKTTGLMIGVKPTDPKLVERFENGEFTGFSIGGQRIEDEEVDDDDDVEEA